MEEKRVFRGVRWCVVLIMVAWAVTPVSAAPRKAGLAEKLTPAEYLSRYLDAFQKFERGEALYDKIEAAMKAENVVAILQAANDQNTEYLGAMESLPRASEKLQIQVTGLFFNGIDGLLSSNNAFMKAIESMAGDAVLEKKMEAVAATKEAAYEKIIQSAGLLLLVVAEEPKDDAPSGRIPYKISDAERQALKEKFNRYFSGPYADAVKQLKRMAKGADTASNFADIALVRIYESIGFDTYEEVRKKSLLRD